MKKSDLERIAIKKIKEVFDPEIPVDVYELGLIYDVMINEDYSINVVMTLTSPSCPVAEILPEQVKQKLLEIENINIVEIDVIWNPSWNKEMMSDVAKLELGML